MLVEEGVIPFAEYCAKVKEHVERSHGVRVVTRDIPDPLIGDLDGLEIHIDHDVSSGQRLFLRAHLFGHTVQWNTDPEAFEVGRLHQPPVSEELLPAILHTCVTTIAPERSGTFGAFGTATRRSYDRNRSRHSHRQSDRSAVTVW